MGKKTPRDPLAVAIGGPVIAIHADRLIFWSISMDRARDLITTDPQTASVVLKELASQTAKFCAMARRDDPTLPEEYRHLLDD